MVEWPKLKKWKIQKIIKSTQYHLVITLTSLFTLTETDNVGSFVKNLTETSKIEVFGHTTYYTDTYTTKVNKQFKNIIVEVNHG